MAVNAAAKAAGGKAAAEDLAVAEALVGSAVAMAKAVMAAVSAARAARAAAWAVRAARAARADS